MRQPTHEGGPRLSRRHGVAQERRHAREKPGAEHEFAGRRWQQCRHRIIRESSCGTRRMRRVALVTILARGMRFWGILTHFDKPADPDGAHLRAATETPPDLAAAYV